MSADGDDGPGRRETAVRVFAAEYDDADLTVTEGEGERAPNYVITPTGARANRVFVVGVLTAVETVSDGVLRARIADPTGAFVVYAGQYQPDALAALEDLEPPTFVAVTGKARTFEPEDGDRVFTSVRPESVSTVDAEARDRWVVRTAERTLERVSLLADALDRPERGEDLRDALEADGVPDAAAHGIAAAIDHYGTGPAYLAAIRTAALDAVRVVTGERDAVESPDVAPDADGQAGIDLTYTGGIASAASEDRDMDVEATGEETEAAPTTETASTPTADETSSTSGEASTTTDETADDTVPTTDEATSPASEAASTGDGEDVAAAAANGDADDQYELDPAEREAVEEEYGVEFSSGTEIPDAGEADIDVPEPESEDETATDQEGDATEESEPAEDLEDVVVDRMSEIAGDDGASREEVVAAVREERDVSAEAVEDAIQGALMNGRCYESGEDELTPI